MNPGAQPSLRLLDGVRWYDEPLPPGRGQALIAALVAAEPGGLGVDALVDAIWDDQPPEHPDKAVQVLVSRVRNRTAPEVLERTGSGYRLGLRADDVDVLRLRRLLGSAREARAAGDLDVARIAAGEVSRTPISGSADSGPLADVLDSAHRDRAEARALLGSVLLALGSYDEALPVLEEALGADAANESLLAEVLRAEAETRGVPVALARYAAYDAGVRDRLGVDPGEQLRRLHVELLARDAPVRQGLKYDAAPLFGRDADVVAIRGLLDTARVVSIVGAGGLGKTRMAHLVGRLEVRPVVYFVELVGVSAPEGVVPEVAHTLGVPESGAVLGRRRPSVDRRTPPQLELLGRVAEQLTAPTLLILDNCEHVIDGAADLVAFLVATTDTVRVLTTSRTPLGIAAEQVYLLPQLGTDDAVALFEQRARWGRSSVRLDRDEVEALVTRLDGLPLAIELAAAKVRVMSVAEITRRLEDRFALLTSADRAAPDRHRTLEAVIAWSWNLLRPGDQEALMTLAAFPDGFTLAAAEAVLGSDALACLSELVDQSLLVVQETAALRYRFLETVREFGALRRAESDPEDRTREVLRRWALDTARELTTRLFSPEQISAVESIEAESGNLVAQLRRALAAGDADAAVVLMGCLSGYWTIRGDHFAVLEFSGRFLQVAQTAQPVEDLARWRAVVGATVATALMFSGSVVPEQLDLLDRLGAAGDGSFGDAMRELVLVLARAEDPRAAAARLAESDGVEMRRLGAMMAAHLAENAGDLDSALAYARAGLDLVDPDRGPWLRGLTQSQVCSIYASRGDFTRARQYAEAAIPVIAAVRADADVVQLRVMVAMAILVDGQLDDAAASLDELEQLPGGADDLGEVRSALLGGRAELALARGEVDEGLAMLREAAEAALHRGEMFADRLADSGAGMPWDSQAPWIVYAMAVAVFAHSLHGQPDTVAPWARHLAETLPARLVTESPVDFPVAGVAMVALGAWSLAVHSGVPPEDAVRLLAVGDASGYPRYQPVMSWAHVERVARPHRELLAQAREEYAALSPAELLDEAGRLLKSAATSSD